jgi:hypothetical protein
VAAGAILATAPAVATASVTLGPPDLTNWNSGISPGGEAETFFQDDIGTFIPISAPYDGVVVTFRALFGATPKPKEVRFRVLEQLLGQHVRGINSTPAFTPEGVEKEIAVPARVPIAKDQFIGIDHPHGVSLRIHLQSETNTWVMPSPPQDGQTATAEPGVSALGLLNATIEPDADHDGYGDETQDGCPASAASHTTCPPATPAKLVSLSSFALARKSSVVVLVSTDATAPVSVSGSVKLPKGPKKRAHASALTKLPAATQTVAPGQIAQLTLTFPKALTTALARLPKRKSLKLEIDAAATNATGQASTSKSTAKLRGTKST